MWSQFLFENLHFAINLFAALAFFSIFWLYFDAWMERKTFKEGLKIIGFLLLSLSFLAHATLIETQNLTVSIFGGGLNEKVSLVLSNLGFIFLLVGLLTDPLIPKPKYQALIAINLSLAYFQTPLLAVFTAWLYLRRATIGLENHTKKVSLAFFFFSLYELLCVPSLFINNPNVDIFRLVSPFGPIWIAAHSVLAIGAGILLGWAFSYLLKRINTQLFIIFTTTILSIFLLTTISFSFLLLKNLSDETLTRLSTDVSVLSFALDAKKSETLASATVLAQNQAVIDALANSDRKVLSTAAENLLLDQKVSSVIVINGSGQVLARGEERDRIGDSISSDSLVKKALIGQKVSSMTTKEGALAPTILVKAAVPITQSGSTIGAVIVAVALDNNFFDGIKKVTGLEVSAYSSDTLSATTISDLAGTTRPIGIKETNTSIKNTVLIKGQSHSGLVSLLNTTYFAVYQPLKDADNTVIGMLLVGRPGSSIFATAGRSIEMTFLVATALILLSIFPSYFIAKYITSQLK